MSSSAQPPPTPEYIIEANHRDSFGWLRELVRNPSLAHEARMQGRLYQTVHINAHPSLNKKRSDEKTIGKSTTKVEAILLTVHVRRDLCIVEKIAEGCFRLLFCIDCLVDAKMTVTCNTKEIFTGMLKTGCDQMVSFELKAQPFDDIQIELKSTAVLSPIVAEGKMLAGCELSKVKYDSSEAFRIDEQSIQVAFLPHLPCIF